VVNVLFVTGAGISANAGIPTYRDGGSSWKDEDLEKKSHASRYGNHLDELWDKHWGPVSKAMSEARPTYAHRAIAEFQKNTPSIIATQNIDSLHERAGSDNVAHVHGSMTVKCIRCKMVVETEWVKGAPVCPSCGKAKTRPDVVLFGEKLDQRLFNALDSFAKAEDTVIISVGTSLNVFPAAGLVMDNLGKKRVIIINKEGTAFDKFATEAIHEDCDSVIDDVLASI
jgi:NAD-dependent deacetylase